MQHKIKLLIFIILPLIVTAQTTIPLSTDRPDQTETPHLVTKGYFQIESGVVLSKDDPVEDISITTNDIAKTLLRYGLNQTFELRLSGGYIQEQIQYLKGSENISGFGAVTLGTKIHLLETNDWIPQCAVIAFVALPLGDKYFADDELIPGFTFAGANDVTDWFGVSYNLGFRYRKDRNSAYSYSLALGFQPLKKIGVFVEVFGSAAQTRTPRNTADFGMTYLVMQNLQLDTSYGVALNNFSVDSFFNFGLSLRLPR